MSIEDLLVRVPQIDPSAEAVESEGAWWTWGELSGLVDEIRGRLDAAGVPVGARIGLLLRNRAPQLAALMACVIGRRCAVAFNPALPPAKLADDVGAQRPAMLIGAPEDVAAEVRAAAQALAAPVLELPPSPRGRPRWLTAVTVAPPQPAGRITPEVMLEMLSSGTTGAPKRIPLAREVFNQSVKSAQAYEQGRESDAPVLRSGVRLQTAPMTHISGMFTGLMTLAEGRKLALMEKFSVAAWVDAVERVKPRIGNLPPAALRMILDAKPPRERLASLVALRSGTAPVDPAIIDGFQQRYGLPVLVQYGATEFAGAVAGWDATAFRALYAQKRGSVGRVQPGIEARVVDPDSGEVLAPGAQGVLELRGRQVGDAENWVRTTDRASLDADGYLWIHGRADNVINRGGFKVQPDDVVRVLEEHPAIREASVVGVPDARLGETPAAAIVLAAGQAEPPAETLRAWLRDRLAAYQVPTRFLFVDELPRTPSLKPSLPEVRRLFGAT